jgi:hypothetical protein
MVTFSSSEPNMLRLRTRSMSLQRVFASIISSVSTVMLQTASPDPLQSGSLSICCRGGGQGFT